MSALAMLAVSMVVSAPHVKARFDRVSMAATPRSTPWRRDSADSSSRRAARVAAGRAVVAFVVGVTGAGVVVVMVGE